MDFIPIRAKENFLVFGSPLIEQKEIDEFVASLKSGWIGTGPMVAHSENEFKEYIGSQYAVAVNSCIIAFFTPFHASGQA